MAKVRKDQCRFCGSRSCYMRVYTADYQFDELACRDHQRDLEVYSDGMLGKAPRMHQSSSGKLVRGVRDYHEFEQEMEQLAAARTLTC